MKSYTDLKPVDSPWLSEVPTHWEVSRFRFEAIINGGLIDPRETPWKDMTLIAPNHVESGTGRVISKESAAFQGADSGKYTVSAGQTIYSKIRPALNKVTVVNEDCLCSADMYAISFRETVDTRYSLYYMLARPFHGFATVMSMRVKMPKVNREELADAPWLVPPIDEQRSIANYLDREMTQIDTLIEEQKRLIEMLRERRRAVIVRAVTKGLNDSVPVQDTLIDWIEKSPAHWRIATLRRVGRFITGTTPSGDPEVVFDDEGAVGWARPEDLAREVKPTKRLSESGVKQVRVTRGAVLVCGIGTVGKVGFAEGDCASNQQITAISTNFNGVYWYYALMAANQSLMSFSMGNTMRILNNERLASLPVVIPPLEEQQAIADFLDEQTAKIDTLIAETERFIELSRERRSALITAAVTGQIDVRQEAL